MRWLVVDAAPLADAPPLAATPLADAHLRLLWPVEIEKNLCTSPWTATSAFLVGSWQSAPSSSCAGQFTPVSNNVHATMQVTCMTKCY